MTTYFKLAILFLLAVCSSGCERPLHAEAPVLNGAIPRCAVLLSESRAAYREAAKLECEAIDSPEARRKSGACRIADYTRMCTEWQ